MNAIVRTRARVSFSMLAVVFSGMLLFGCGGGGNGVGPDQGGGTGKTPLLLEDGFAWTNSEGDGYVFLPDNNRVLVLSRYSDVWMIVKDDGFQVNKNGITISTLGSGTFSVNGNTLTLKIGGKESVFTKTETKHKPNDLVLWLNQAWADGDGSHDEGLMFLADGRIFKIDHGWVPGGGWRIEQKGTYRVYGTGGTGIDRTWDNESLETGTFTVSGDTLRITFPVGGRPKEYTKRSGVNVDIDER
jgi:hypothetical protein